MVVSVIVHVDRSLNGSRGHEKRTVCNDLISVRKVTVTSVYVGLVNNIEPTSSI